MDNLIELVSSEKKDVAVRTEVICILDRSGSMSDTAADSIGGYNTFIKKQIEQDPDCRITLVLFDHEYNVLYENTHVNDVVELDSNTYIPRGNTALNDAIGKTIVTVRERHVKMAESDRPTNVVVAILTDGMENSSKEYEPSNIKTLIEKYETEYNWKFLYLAANQDAFLVGKNYGFQQANSVTFNNTDVGRGMAFANVANFARLSKSVDSVELRNKYSAVDEQSMDVAFKKTDVK